MPADVTLKRLDEQIGWYGSRSRWNQFCYRSLKVIVIVAAATIPVLSSFEPDVVPRWVLGALGALVAVIEGVQQVFQFHANWISYRATAEGLKREKFLYLAKADPYAAPERDVLLAERIEALMTQENAKWVSSQDIADKAGGKPSENSTKSPETSAKPPEDSTKPSEDPTNRFSHKPAGIRCVEMTLNSLCRLARATDGRPRKIIPPFSAIPPPPSLPTAGPYLAPPARP
jgi:Protein of unknown function (DUF4231)